MGVLLLDASYTPVHVVTIPRAFCLVFAEKAEVLEADPEDVWRSPRQSFPVPKVIRLIKSVKIPYRARLPLTRKALLVRDKGRCAYEGQPRPARAPKCTGRATTIDHVIPRAQLGNRAHRWENVVGSCPACNQFKSDRSLTDLGWALQFKPHAPTGTRWLIVGLAKPDPAWEAYLGPAVA